MVDATDVGEYVSGVVRRLEPERRAHRDVVVERERSEIIVEEVFHGESCVGELLPLVLVEEMDVVVDGLRSPTEI